MAHCAVLSRRSRCTYRELGSRTFAASTKWTWISTVQVVIPLGGLYLPEETGLGNPHYSEQSLYPLLVPLRLAFSRRVSLSGLKLKSKPWKLRHCLSLTLGIISRVVGVFQWTRFGRAC